MDERKKYFKFKIDVIQAMAEKGINSYTCRNNKSLGQRTLTRLRNGDNVSLNTACKVCAMLGITLSDMVDVVAPDEEMSNGLKK